MLAIFLRLLGIPGLASPASGMPSAQCVPGLDTAPFAGAHGTSASTTLHMLPQKLGEQPAHVFRLLLLHPVTGTVQQMTASHVRAGAGLHALEVARALIHSPVALASKEQRRYIDGAAGEGLECNAILAPCSAAEGISDATVSAIPWSRSMM